MTEHATAATGRQGGRPTLVVTSTFPVHPNVFGGQQRTYGLMRELGRDADVHIVSLTEHGERPGHYTLAPGLTETTVPKTQRHSLMERDASAWAGRPVGDIMSAELVAQSPEYLACLGQALGHADGVVVTHPYLCSAVREFAPDLPLAYDAANAETQHKRATLPSSPDRTKLIDRVRRLEAVACASARLVYTPSEPDAQALMEEFALGPERLMTVANGVDAAAVPYVGGAERRRRREAWLRALLAVRGGGDWTRLAVFTGSNTAPNVIASQHIARTAVRLPRFLFTLLGGISDGVDPQSMPPNVLLSGWLAESTKRQVLAAADVALNPVTTGFGSNLKVPEYLAAGTPLVTTSVGARGFDLDDGEHALIRETGEFAAAMSDLGLDQDRADRLAADARELVVKCYSWPAIARPWRARLIEALGL